jgi:hypothetical protein
MAGGTVIAAWVVLLAAGGCAKTPPAKQTGFLSDYSRLRQINDRRMNYVSPTLRDYQSYMIDPIEFRTPPEKLSPKQRAQVAQHFHQRLREVLQQQGFAIVTEPDVGVARVSIALTDVANSTWWKKVHPVARSTGAGTGGAAMEGEVIDSVTGEQLAAFIQASPGNQFNFLAFSTVADINSAIDKWADQAARRLKELRSESP